MDNTHESCLYDNFPLSIVTIRIILMGATVITGSTMLYHLHLWAMIAYLVINIIGVYAILILVCRYCYYQSKRCDLSLGLLAGFLFKKGEEEDKFVRNAPKTIPFLILMILPPSIIGIILFIQQLSTIILLLLVTNIVSITTFIITTRDLSCPNCKMQSICSFCMVPKTKRISKT